MTDLDLSVADCSAWSRHSPHFLGTEGLLIKVDGPAAPFTLRYVVTAWYPSGMGYTFVPIIGSPLHQPSDESLAHHRLIEPIAGGDNLSVSPSRPRARRAFQNGSRQCFTSQGFHTKTPK